MAGIEHGYLSVSEFLLEVEKVFESGIEVVLEGKREAARCPGSVKRWWGYDDTK